MPNPFPVFLIDLDSVLIEPLGYRKTIQAALAYFTEHMGLGNLYPGEDAVASLEAINMTCEWDILSILLAAIFDGLAGENSTVLFPEDLLAACETVKQNHLPSPTLDLARIRALLAKNFKPGMEFASLALELSQSSEEQSPYPNLCNHPLLSSILANTRLMDGALTTRVFQHFTLGSQGFAQLTGKSPLFESESYLLKYDRVLLEDQTRMALLNKWREKKIGLAIYTARPSLPETQSTPTYNYSPEAEVALEALNLSEIPLVGAGKMGWLATELGLRVDQLTKPSPVQALAAIASAVTRQTKPALKAAAALHLQGEVGIFKDFPPLSIHVFEDAGGNVASVRCAVDQLIAAGVPCRFTAWGIGDNPLKQQALKQAGASLVPEINLAVMTAIIQE